jgi:hypothetical protein
LKRGLAIYTTPEFTMVSSNGEKGSCLTRPVVVMKRQSREQQTPDDSDALKDREPMLCEKFVENGGELRVNFRKWSPGGLFERDVVFRRSQDNSRQNNYAFIFSTMDIWWQHRFKCLCAVFSDDCEVAVVKLPKVGTGVGSD